MPASHSSPRQFRRELSNHISFDSYFSSTAKFYNPNQHNTDRLFIVINRGFLNRVQFVGLELFRINRDWGATGSDLIATVNCHSSFLLQCYPPPWTNIPPRQFRRATGNKLSSSHSQLQPSLVQTSAFHSPTIIPQPIFQTHTSHISPHRPCSSPFPAPARYYLSPPPFNPPSLYLAHHSTQSRHILQIQACPESGAAYWLLIVLSPPKTELSLIQQRQQVLTQFY